MSQANRDKRKKAMSDVKSIIAMASLTATIAGWAMLPSNDPAPTVTTPDTISQQVASSIPPTQQPAGQGFTLEIPTVPAAPTQVPAAASAAEATPTQVPAVAQPQQPATSTQGSGSRRPQAITRSRSSR